MKEIIKKHIRPLLFSIIMTFSILFLSIMNILRVFNSITSGILDMVLGIVILFALGFIAGKKRKNKGYIGGLIVGTVAIVIMFLVSILIFQVTPNLMMFIYYGILLLSAVLGSMVGINKKKD